MKTKKYKATIQFFYNAEDPSEAIGIADNIADYIENHFDYSADAVKIEAKVGAVRVESINDRGVFNCATCLNGTRNCYMHGKVAV